MKELFPRTKIDWILIGALLPILGAGLVTMNSLGEGTDYFSRQLMWIGISLIIFFIISMVDVRFLRKSNTVISLYLIGIGMLLALFIAGSTVKGATSWLDLGGFSLQPADFMKLILVIVLAKYFSRRHQEIKHPKHIFISAAYMVIPFILNPITIAIFARISDGLYLCGLCRRMGLYGSHPTVHSVWHCHLADPTVGTAWVQQL
jgi:cell division protein FtsW (lipid II flippase)